MSIFVIHTQNRDQNLRGVIFEEMNPNGGAFGHVMNTSNEVIRNYLTCWGGYENAIHFPDADKKEYQ